VNAIKKLPTLFIPHGGGPCFFVDPPAAYPHMWDGLAAYLRGIDAGLGVRPKAVLVISGFAGAVAAGLLTGNADEVRAARIRHGALAGTIAGAVGGLVPTAIFLIFGAMMILGPLAGIVGGVLGGALAADRRLKPRPAHSVATGISVPET